MLKIGDKAPDFKLLDQNGIEHSLKEYSGKKVLIYFYPKDNTPGCTAEACNLRDVWDELKKKNVVVLGVSKDSLKSHANFSQKYNLNFPILSDESTEMIKSYGVWALKKFMGREFLGILRISYLINEDGVIEKVYDKVNTKTHGEDVLKDVSNDW